MLVAIVRLRCGLHKFVTWIIISMVDCFEFTLLTNVLSFLTPDLGAWRYFFTYYSCSIVCQDNFFEVYIPFLFNSWSNMVLRV
jgi:hypothetical protein